MEKFEIKATISGVSFICEEIEVSRSSSLSQTTTVSNGVITRKRGAKRQFMILKGKILSEDYSSLKASLEAGLTFGASVSINDVAYSGAEVYDYNIKIRSGESLGDAVVKLFIDG